MTERRQARSYHLTRPEGVGFFRHWSARQAGVAFSGLFLALLALRVHDALWVRIAMIVIGVSVMGVGLGRAPGGEAVMDVAGPSGRYIARGIAGKHRWVAPISIVGAPPGAGVPPLLGGLVLHELDPGRDLGRTGGPVGLVEDRADASLSIVLRVHGWGFTVAEAEEKDYRLAMWGRALADFCREQHPVCRLSWSQWCAPAGIEEHRAWLAGALRTDADQAMADAYEEVLDRVGRAANRSEALVTVSVALARVKLLPHHGGDKLLAAGEKALEEAELLTRQLRRADLAVSAPLSAGQLARALRDRLDPSAASFLDSRARALGDLAGMVSVENAYPLVTEEARSYLRCDGSYHRAFRVAEWPRTAVRADWMRDFLGMVGVVRSLSVTYHPQSRRQSRWEVDAQASRTEGAIDEKVHKHHHIGAGLRRAAAAIEQIDDELEEGAGMEHFSGIVVVTAPSAEELEYATERARQGASNVGMELRQLEFRHGPAVVAALPLGRSAREGGRG